MPRLLLVDDNESIHKIAETLLATTAIELVCQKSAAGALELIGNGEHFDVALVDTSMAGMDGWELLARLRELPATRMMPIAMMAGVLDTVDPDRLKNAPIQGFLKKPVELRDLGERVTRLMETPVVLPEPPAPPEIPAAPEPPAELPPVAVEPRTPSPFATMPAVRIQDLPELKRPIPAEVPEVDDLLELTEADLFPDAAPEVELDAAEVSLELEELDLESLRQLPEAEPFVLEAEPFAPAAEAPVIQEAPEAAPLAIPADELPSPFDALEPLPEISLAVEEPAEAVGLLAEDLTPITAPETELPDLGPTSEELLDMTTVDQLPELAEAPSPESSTEIPLESLLAPAPVEGSFMAPLPPLEESLDWSDESESLLEAVEAPAPQVETQQVTFSLEEELDLGEAAAAAPAEPSTLQLEASEGLPEGNLVPVTEEPLSTEAIVESALLESASAPVEAEPEVPAQAGATPSGTKELVDAMLADPALLDVLAKAVVARLGDQVLREVAWEVMPELMERMPRN